MSETILIEHLALTCSTAYTLTTNRRSIAYHHYSLPPILDLISIHMAAQSGPAPQSCIIEECDDDPIAPEPHCTHATASTDERCCPPPPSSPPHCHTADDDCREHAEHADDNRPRQPRGDGTEGVRRIFSDPAVIKVLGDLIATLEHIKYENRPRGKRVFNAEWAKNMFLVGLPLHMQQHFDVEAWWERIAKTVAASGISKYDLDPGLVNAEILTDWVGPLIHLESMLPGFIQLFHGVLTLERQSRTKLNHYTHLDNHCEMYGINDDTSGAAHADGRRAHAANPPTFGGLLKYT